MKKAIEIAKKNLVSILCGVAVLVLLGITYIYPLPSSYGALQEDINKSKGMYDQLKGQLNQERLQPKLTLDDSPPPPLPGFPGESVARAARVALESLKREADELLRLAMRNTGEIKPLIEGIFPALTGGATESKVILDFRGEYWRATATDAVGFPNSQYAKILNGTLAPQSTEFENIAASRTADIIAKKTIYGQDNKPSNQEQINKEINDMRADLPRELKLTRAEDHKVYVGPNAIFPHPQLGGQNSPNQPNIDIVTAFNAQYSLWIQELILKAIADVNKDATNVLNAPIKHIVKLNIGAAYNFARQGTPVEPGMPIEPPFNPGAMIAKDYTSDPFGHPAINELYELNTFDLVIRVEAKKVPSIIGALTAGRFLFVNQVSMQSVDTGIALNEGYLYGPEPIVELTLRCNLLILRSQLTPLMPDAVKAYVKSRTAPMPTAG